MRAPRLLIGCERSGIVREAFRRRGVDAVSCDIVPSHQPGPHIQDDVLKHLDDGWDGLIGHPECTYLCSSGLHWNARRPERRIKTERALTFFRKLWRARIRFKALENPRGIVSTRIAKPTQTVQPYEFGEDASKATCLWLQGFPMLKGTRYVQPMFGCAACGERFAFELGKYGCPNCAGQSGAARQVWANQTVSGQNKLGPSKDRHILRSLTYPGIAEAMAEQWAPALFAAVREAA